MRLFFLMAALVLAAHAQNFDVVLHGGRVIDPESKLDAIRDVGITGGKIRAVSTKPLRGRIEMDAKGLVVAPGFIDLHAHGQDLENQRLKVVDGVTTGLELEIGVADPERWYNDHKSAAVINYGASVGHVPLRMSLMNDSAPLVPTGPAAHSPANPEQITDLRRRIELGLKQGALGVGFGIQYTPGASRWEILEMFRVAGRMKAPVFVHMRYMGNLESASAVSGLEELIAASVSTGAPLHLVHVTSSGLRATPQLLQIITEAQKRGVDVTTECYPYAAAMTDLGSAMFDDGWQKVLGVNYPELEWVETSERLTAETFAKYRKKGGLVIMHMIPDDAVRLAVGHPLVMIASDGLITNGKGHPRGTGTYSRVLGKYVREEKVLTLPDAIRKMSYLPAQRLETYVPMMKNKGRIKVGADADLAVFDPRTVIDQATFQSPALQSVGMRYVLVNGVPVVKDGKLDANASPGKPVRGEVQ